jgi:hypothetical protein
VSTNRLACNMVQGLAERRKQKGAVSWQHRPFINQARRDGLQLKHWVKCAKDAAGQVREVNEGDYPFAKCNKQVRQPWVLEVTTLSVCSDTFA